MYQAPTKDVLYVLSDADQHSEFYKQNPEEAAKKSSETTRTN